VIVLRRTRLILACMGDVRRDRSRLARAWWQVRRPLLGGAFEARMLRKALRRLESSERLLVLAWECSVLREATTA
jgi:hypothetical protein